jgi:hypothetical protein
MGIAAGKKWREWCAMVEMREDDRCPPHVMSRLLAAMTWNLTVHLRFASGQAGHGGDGLIEFL